MSYDANSPEVRKARITENCIREILKKTGCTVERPNGRAEGEASLVDFVVTKSCGKKYLVEVKILKRFGYSYGEYPCFTLPVERVNSYVNYAANQGLELCFYIFEQATRTIWAQWLYILESPRPIGKYTFPFNKNTVKGDKRCYHISQFEDTTFNNYNNVFDQLQAIDDERNAEVVSGGTSDCYNPDDFQFDDTPVDIAEDEPNDQTAEKTPTANDKLLRKYKTFRLPNGKILDVYRLDGDDDRWFCLFRQILQIIGFAGDPTKNNKNPNPWQPVIDAANLEFIYYKTDNNPNANIPPKSLDLEIVPEFLHAYIDNFKTSSETNRKAMRRNTAKMLIAFFNSTVLPDLYNVEPVQAPQQTQLQLTATDRDSLIEQLAVLCNLPVDSLKQLVVAACAIKQ